MFISRVLKFSLVFFPIAYFQAGAKHPEQGHEDALPMKGNFALLGSQQLGPFFGFGQNIIDKGLVQFFMFSDGHVGPKQRSVGLFPTLVFGITDSFSAYFEAPINVRNKDKNEHSSGIGDAHLQFEYGIYDCDTKDYVEEATLVGAMFMPTGSVQKNPPTGIGSATFFGGATYNRMYQNWYGYTSHGYEVTTTREGLKPGNTFTYQAGVGLHICSCPEEWIFAALLEVDGHYAGKDKNHGRSDPDSGGNVLLLIPSLWFSTQKITLQFGIGFPLTQHLNGGQRKNNYVIASNFGWTF